jgi:hypothetical protein
MTWLIGVPFSMILGIVAPYATLRQAPVPGTAGDSTMAYGGLLFAGGGMYGQMPAYLNRGPRSLCSRQTISQKSAVSYRPVPHPVLAIR